MNPIKFCIEPTYYSNFFCTGHVDAYVFLEVMAILEVHFKPSLILNLAFRL